MISKVAHYYRPEQDPTRTLKGGLTTLMAILLQQKPPKYVSTPPPQKHISAFNDSSPI